MPANESVTQQPDILQAFSTQRIVDLFKSTLLRPEADLVTEEKVRVQTIVRQRENLGPEDNLPSFMKVLDRLVAPDLPKDQRLDLLQYSIVALGGPEFVPITVENQARFKQAYQAVLAIRQAYLKNPVNGKEVTNIEAVQAVIEEIRKTEKPEVESQLKPEDQSEKMADLVRQLEEQREKYNQERARADRLGTENARLVLAQETSARARGGVEGQLDALTLEKAQLISQNVRLEDELRETRKELEKAREAPVANAELEEARSRIVQLESELRSTRETARPEGLVVTGNTQEILMRYLANPALPLDGLNPELARLVASLRQASQKSVEARATELATGTGKVTVKDKPVASTPVKFPTSSRLADDGAEDLSF